METVWISKDDNRIYTVILCYCTHFVHFVLHIRSIRIKIINRFFVILVGISCGPTIPYAFIYMNSYYQQLFLFASSMFLMVFRFGLWYFSCHFPILLWICVALTNPYPVSFLFFFFFFSFASISLSTFILSLHLSTECSHIHSLYPWYKWMVYFRLNRKYIYP